MMQTLARAINYLFGKLLFKNNIFLSSSLNYTERKREIDKNYFDYVRIATLELLSNEINEKKIVGNVAELGVYKGKFAQYINKYLPDRKFYLFDTFEGFDERDANTEVNKNFSLADQNFSDTTVKNVLSIMPFPDQCIIRKGYFPETANGIEDSFVLVSLDADLYEPTYNGLKYFYPRLQKGGYILVHDYNNDHYKGAKQAVQQFCTENQLCYVPIVDKTGTAIITK